MLLIKFDDNLKELANTVREERKHHKTCLSAQDNIDMNLLIKEIIDTNTYQKDYENITSALLFKQVDYNEAKTVLDEIIKEEIFKKS